MTEIMSSCFAESIERNFFRFPCGLALATPQVPPFGSLWSRVEGTGKKNRFVICCSTTSSGYLTTSSEKMCFGVFFSFVPLISGPCEMERDLVFPPFSPQNGKPHGSSSTLRPHLRHKSRAVHPGLNPTEHRVLFNCNGCWRTE